MAISGIGRKFSSIFAGALALSQLSSAAYAQTPASCACTGSVASIEGTVGEIISARGEVLVLQSSGYVPAAPGTPLSSRSQIMLGPDAAASLSVGSDCRLNVAGNRDIRLSPVPDGICVAVNNPVVVPMRGSNRGQLILGVVGALAVGGVVAIAVGSDGDVPVSP